MNQSNEDESNTFTWIHLSDLHIRSETIWDSDQITSGLFSDIKQRIEKQSFYPDAIFFTGDAVFGDYPSESIKDQYNLFANFLDTVRGLFSPEFPKDRIYLVPGNHDIDRNEVLDSDTLWLRDPKRSLNEITSEISNISKSFRHWTNRQRAYREFISSYKLDHLDPSNLQSVWHSIIEKNGTKIGIAGLNSSWSCATNGEKGLLWMGAKWQANTLRLGIGDVDITIALVHHPSNWLVEQEDPDAERTWHRKFNILLHGHEHKSFIDEKPGEELKISAGACYERDDRPKAYSIVQLDLTTYCVKIFPREWDVDGEGWVSKNIAGKAENGVFESKPLKKIGNLEKAPRRADEKSSPKENLLTIEGGPSQTALNKKINHLRRRPYAFEPHHSRVRINQRSLFEGILANKKIGIVSADWQVGKDGFISGVLNNLGSHTALEQVFRIDCASLEHLQSIPEEGDAQLGIPFVEFAEVTRLIDQGTLVLEDFPANLLRSPSLVAEAISYLENILTFSPSLRIIVTTRQRIEALSSSDYAVDLESLDLDEISEYLRYHPRGSLLRSRSDRIEDIHEKTGGLPSAIDRLIVQSELVRLDDLLDDQISENTTDESSEEIPKSLVAAVNDVFKVKTDSEKRVLSLLKLLTVLRDGETLDSIRRVYPTKPFREEHVLALAKDGLIETLPIEQRTTNFVKNGIYRRLTPEPPKLLRIPRQVRDCVSSLISDREKSQIYDTVSSSLFGENWYEGKIKLRRTIIVAYKQSSIAGPANELLVAQYLLRSSIDKNHTEKIERFAKLSVGYCNELITADRFRDAKISCRAILKMLDPVEQNEHWVTCSYIYGRALRMTGDHELAVEVFEGILEDHEIRTKDFKADIHLNLAWSYQTLDKDDISAQHAQFIVNESVKETANWIEACVVLVELELSGGKLDTSLRRLYSVAKRKEHVTVANNIALKLARIGTSESDSLKLLDEVLNTSTGLYNRTRAAVDKAELLAKKGRIIDMTAADESALCDAYEYSCSQRLKSLLDSSHEALWEFSS